METPYKNTGEIAKETFNLLCKAYQQTSYDPDLFPLHGLEVLIDASSILPDSLKEKAKDAGLFDISYLNSVVERRKLPGAYSY